MADTFSGKRVLNMAVARTMIPPSCYMYETTDGKRVRIFFDRDKVRLQAQRQADLVRCGVALPENEDDKNEDSKRRATLEKIENRFENFCAKRFSEFGQISNSVGPAALLSHLS